jgi:hypothetical protein
MPIENPPKKGYTERNLYPAFLSYFFDSEIQREWKQGARKEKLHFMKKVNETVRKESLYIAAFVLILSLLMEAIWLILGSFWQPAAWNFTILTGNLLGAGAAILNFFLMAQTVAKAVEEDQESASRRMKASHSVRYLLLFLVLVLAIFLDQFFNILAVILPLLFPRIAIMLRPKFGHYTEEAGVTPPSDSESGSTDSSNPSDSSDSSDGENTEDETQL